MNSFLDGILAQAQKQLEDPVAQAYLLSRGVSLEQARGLGIGYFGTETWPPRVVGNSEDVENWKHWSSNGYRLRGKLVFPITNAAGMVRGLQVRSPNPEVKDYSKFYLVKSSVDALFFGTPSALPSIWETRCVYLCEGLFDLPPLARVFPNTLCTGTAQVSKTQLAFLMRWADEVCVVFDTDWGGDRFWKEFSEKHTSSFERIWRMRLPAKDCSELWARVGEDRFRGLLQQRVGF